jgi:RHH-type transcriptional regulator, rel operon repressor / antitoxin RelB
MMLLRHWVRKSERVALAAIAAGLDRDRSYIINEAINLYLEVYHWQVEEIKQGIAEADAEGFATEDDVQDMFARSLLIPTARPGTMSLSLPKPLRPSWPTASSLAAPSPSHRRFPTQTPAIAHNAEFPVDPASETQSYYHW